MKQIVNFELCRLGYDVRMLSQSLSLVRVERRRADARSHRTGVRKTEDDELPEVPTTRHASAENIWIERGRLLESMG